MRFDRPHPWSDTLDPSLEELKAGRLAALRAREPARERSVAAIAARPGRCVRGGPAGAAAGSAVPAGVRLHAAAGG